MSGADVVPGPRVRPAPTHASRNRATPAATRDVTASIGDSDHPVVIGFDLGEHIVLLMVAVDSADAVDAFLFGVPAHLLEELEPIGGVGPVAEITELQDRIAAVTPVRPLLAVMAQAV